MTSRDLRSRPTLLAWSAVALGLVLTGLADGLLRLAGSGFLLPYWLGVLAAYGLASCLLVLASIARIAGRYLALLAALPVLTIAVGGLVTMGDPVHVIPAALLVYAGVSRLSLERGPPSSSLTDDSKT